MTKGICDSSAKTATGRCHRRGIYKVNGEDACGLHLAAVVKFNLEFRPEVTVTKVDAQSGANDSAEKRGLGAKSAGGAQT